MNVDELSQQLNTVKCYDVEEVKVGDALYYTLNYNYDSLFLLKLIFHFVRNTLFWNNVFEVYGKPNTLFFISSSNIGRSEMLTMVRKVASTTSNYVVMIGKRTFKMHMGFLRYLPIVFVWNKQLKVLDLSWQVRWHCLDALYGYYMDYKEHGVFRKKEGCTINALVTLFDVYCAENFFTQMYNANNKLTITLQHGFFSATASRRAYTASCSDKFLLNSMYSMSEAKKCVDESDKFVVGGLPSYIGTSFKEKTYVHKPIKKIGVMLDGEPLHKNNVEMLKVMQRICSKMGCDIYIKMHPLSEESGYKDIIDYSLRPHIYGSEITIIEFGKMIDIGVVMTSTVLLEMFMQCIPTFIFCLSPGKCTVYEELQELHFHDFQSFEEKITLLSKEGDSIIKKYREYFGGYDNIAERYASAFEAMGIKE